MSNWSGLMYEWRKTTWGDVVKFQRGFDITKDEQALDGSVPVVSSGGVSSYHDRAMADGPGVIIGRKGTLGKVHFVDGPFWPHDTTLWVSDFKGNSQRFVYYALMGIDVATLNVGSASPTLNRNHLHPLPVLWPNTLLEQERIAAVLAALDDKIAANARISRLSLELAQQLFARERRAAVWDLLSLTEICTRGWLQLGDGYRTNRSEHGEPGLRILRAGDVGLDSIDPSGSDFVSDEYRSAIGAKASQPGDVVMTTKGTVGRVAVVPFDMEQVVYSPQLCYFRVLDPTRLAPGFLSAWFRSNDLQRQAEARMYKSDMAPYINLKDIQSMTIPLPPPAEQQRIGEFQSNLERMAHAVQRENRVLARTREELLPLLMSGKIKVREAEQAASALL